MIYYFAEATSFITFFYPSFLEWFLRRFLMHESSWAYPFRSQALIHHI